jgi:L-ascorbate metabolism protein UlaG (beta-lactamase superfamily)
MAGFLINSRGTTVMIDPLLGGFDMPIMIEMPVAATDVPRVDAVLVTHNDNDHFSVPTCRDLARSPVGFTRRPTSPPSWPKRASAVSGTASAT